MTSMTRRDGAPVVALTERKLAPLTLLIVSRFCCARHPITVLRGVTPDMQQDASPGAKWQKPSVVAKLRKILKTAVGDIRDSPKAIHEHVGLDFYR
jgi:hypothetical protein